MDRAATGGIHSQGSDRPEDVVVAGGGVVAADDRSGIEEEHAEVVNPAAHPLAVAATVVAFPALGPVVGNAAARDRDTGVAGNRDATPKAVAAVTAGAAAGRIVAQRTVADRGGRAGIDKEAAP